MLTEMPIKRKLPPLGEPPDYSCAFYADPPSHDFCVWLIIAELMRRYHNAPAPLKVKLGLINDQLGMLDFAKYSVNSGESTVCEPNKQYSDTMIDNVLRPAMEMIGAIEEPPEYAEFNHDKLPFDNRGLSKWVEYDFHIGHLVDAGKEGYEIPKWKPPQWAHDEVAQFLNGEKPVIITLRETTKQPERNSRFDEWMKFAASIKNNHPVLILHDTYKADEPCDYKTWPRASTNAFVRAALYQQALVNMMVCNGPNTWVIFSGAPYLIFKELIPELPGWAHGNATGWEAFDHMKVGDQYAWANSKQRLTWTDDTFENISNAFGKLFV